MNKNRIIKEYKDFLNEDVFNLEDVEKIDNFLDITNKEKDILKKFQEIVINIKKVKFSLNDFKIEYFDFIDSQSRYLVILPEKLIIYINQILDLYYESKDNVSSEILDIIHEKFFIRDKEDNIIYDDDVEDSINNTENKGLKLKHYLNNSGKIKGYIIIDIEKKNSNRIHVPYGIPNYLRGLNLGEFIYLTVCKELGYISTINNHHFKYSPSFGAKGIWLKMIQNELVYSIMDKNKILCIDVNYDYSKIITIIKIWFNNYLKKSNNNLNYNFMIDPDLINILKDTRDEEIKFLIKKSLKRD